MEAGAELLGCVVVRLPLLPPRPIPSRCALALWLLGCSACSAVEASELPLEPQLHAPAAPVAQGSSRGATARDSPRSELVRRSVRLEILGDFPESAIPAIEAGLQHELRVQVLPTSRRPLPQEAYYRPRKRYRAEKLLRVLEREQPARTSVLGMTEVDISTTKGHYKDWGVFGLGMIGGTSSVISTFRLRRGRPSAELYRFRIVSAAVHEVGHMLGLNHCTEPRCVMNDAEGSIETVDNSTGALGPGCLSLLDRLAPATRAPLP